MDHFMMMCLDFRDGFYDSIISATIVIVSARQKQTNVLKRIRQCGVLSAVLILSLVIFKLILKMFFFMVSLIIASQEIKSMTLSWLEPILSSLFNALWVLPLIFLSRIVTALWFQDIADTSFRGRPQAFRKIPQIIADNLFNFLIQLLFLVQANLFTFFPIGFLGQSVSILHTSLLYSLYSFEYKWYNLGWKLHQRLYYIEQNWPYFFGFGLPLALLTHYVSNYYLNTAFFSLLFPLYILTANETSLHIRSKWKIPFFSLVVWCSNKLLSFSVPA